MLSMGTYKTFFNNINKIMRIKFRQFTRKHLLLFFFFFKDNVMESYSDKFKQNSLTQFIYNWKFSVPYFSNETFLFVLESFPLHIFIKYFHFQPTGIQGSRLLGLTYEMLFIGHWHHLYLLHIMEGKCLISIYSFSHVITLPQSPGSD